LIWRNVRGELSSAKARRLSRRARDDLHQSIFSAVGYLTTRDRRRSTRADLANQPVRSSEPTGLSERVFRRALFFAAVAGLLLGLIAWALGGSDLGDWCWAGGVVPVVIGLLVSMVRDFLAGRVGVDAVAFVSMSGALALGQYLAGIVIAIMYAGGNILEDFAVARAERDL
jgi:cation transport ATPase